MKSNNIIYNSENMANYYKDNRTCWDDFYVSEKWIFEKMHHEKGTFGKVLDVGCATGGLGVALAQKFKVDLYHGVDINEPSIRIAKRRKVAIPYKVEYADILDKREITGEPFDTVVSLSCADWNIDTKQIIDACWKRLKAGGKFIISLRLTNQKGINNIAESYQYVCFDGPGDESCEKANYVVFNINEILEMFTSFSPSLKQILGYGYWGKPSQSAITPYQELCFVVFALEKGPAKQKNRAEMELHLPLDLFAIGGRK